MVTASRILGDEVGSTAPGFLAFLAVHVIAGLAAMRWAEDYYLFILGAVAFTAATTGYLHRRRHRPGDTGHITGMGIAYTAMLTAFYVDNGPHLTLWDRLPTLAFWILPAAIAAPVITRAIIRARNMPPRHQHKSRPDPAISR
ncbi:MAG TPA: hypothetical protein VFV73_20375 [Streptosporangiaceae bacterium]|nr:hypothetical protein [Streptosporangiaceae bacterium]